MVNDSMFQLVLIGDSDIAFWPKELYPSLSTKTSGSGKDPVSLPTKPTIVDGYSGATLAEVASRLRDIRAKIVYPKGSREEASPPKGGQQGRYIDLIVVGCAGENDIGNGLSLDHSLSSLESFLEGVFSMETKIDSKTREITQVRVAACIFLGPKYEPWLEDEVSYKKKYSKMARSFERSCQRSSYSTRIQFLDCLTLFCGETANLPGAKLAGRGVAQEEYFAPDRLHLSQKGYQVWKELVEDKILQIL